jgi:putative transposase
MDVGNPIVSIHAWTLMPNHFHLVLSELVEGGISLFMKSLAGAYVKYFNKKHNRTGTLFEGRFKSKHAESDKYAKYLFAYVSLNRIKLVPGESKWREQGIGDMGKIKKFIDTDERSSLFDYLYNDSPRLFSMIILKDFYKNYFFNKKFVEREIFSWLKLKGEGAEAVLNFK